MINDTYPLLEYSEGKGLKMVPKPKVEQSINHNLTFNTNIFGTLTLSVFNTYFGLVDGFINSLPQQDLLQYCGRFNAAQRQGITWLYNNFTENMDLGLSMDAIVYTVRL